MKDINIQINKAKIISYEIELLEKYPDVNATIGLYAGKKLVSKFTLSTKSWQDITFELPISLIAEIKSIAEELENILIIKCSQSIGELPSGRK